MVLDVSYAFKECKERRPNETSRSKLIILKMVTTNTRQSK